MNLQRLSLLQPILGVLLLLPFASVVAAHSDDDTYGPLPPFVPSGGCGHWEIESHYFIPCEDETANSSVGSAYAWSGGHSFQGNAEVNTQGGHRKSANCREGTTSTAWRWVPAPGVEYDGKVTVPTYGATVVGNITLGAGGTGASAVMSGYASFSDTLGHEVEHDRARAASTMASDDMAVSLGASAGIFSFGVEAAVTSNDAPGGSFPYKGIETRLRTDPTEHCVRLYVITKQTGIFVMASAYNPSWLGQGSGSASASTSGHPFATFTLSDCCE